MRLRLISGKKYLKPTGATLTPLGEVVDVASEEGQLALVDVHELVVKRVHHSLVQVELLHIVASVKGTFKGTIENESERNGKYFQTIKKIKTLPFPNVANTGSVGGGNFTRFVIPEMGSSIRIWWSLF